MKIPGHSGFFLLFSSMFKIIYSESCGLHVHVLLAVVIRIMSKSFQLVEGIDNRDLEASVLPLWLSRLSTYLVTCKLFGIVVSSFSFYALEISVIFNWL